MRAALVELFRIIVAVLVPLASFTTGLRARHPGGQPLWRRPLLLCRCLATILVIVPLWALAVVRIVPVAPVVGAGLLIAVIAVGIGPVAGLKRMDPRAPDAGHALELNIEVLGLSILFVPAAFSALALLYGRRVGIDPWEVAKVVLLRALLPLVVGLAVARLAPRLAERAGPVLGKGTRLVFALLVAVALAATWRQLLSIGATGWLAGLLVASGSVLIGHLLGGPEPGSRATLAAASAMRFPALGLLLASVTAQPARLTAVVLAYVICAFVAVSLYELWLAVRRRRSPAKPERATTSVPSVRSHLWRAEVDR